MWLGGGWSGQRLNGAYRKSSSTRASPDIDPELISQEEDSLRMHELYNSVPSPSEPTFEWSTGAADDEVFGRLMANEEPKGIRTRLYKYQFVR